MFSLKLLTPMAVALGIAYAATGASAGPLLGTVAAGFTPINSVGGSANNERCAVGTVASGGEFCKAGGKFGGQESIAHILSREVGGLTRVQDFDGSVPLPPGAGAHNTLDQLWSTDGKSANVRATARYLGATVETLGYIEGATPLATNADIGGAAFHPLLPLLGKPNQLQTSVAVAGVTSDIKPITAGFVNFAPDDVFRFAIKTNISLALGDANWTSFQGKGDGTGGDPQTGDHMVAFQWDSDPNAYFIFFDDQPGALPADFDFNDTIFEVHFLVPEPASLTLFGIGLIGLGALSRRRKAANAA